MDEEVFWQAVAASVAAATFLSTGLAWAAGTWARNRSRAEADWVVDASAFVIPLQRPGIHLGPEGHIKLSGRIANAGDAKAFRLTMTTSHGEGGLMTPVESPTTTHQHHKWLAVVDVGDTFEIWATVPPEKWNGCVITLDWITAPTRLRKHLQFELKPSDTHPDPRPLYS